jgi:hypothetical protein
MLGPDECEKFVYSALTLAGCGLAGTIPDSIGNLPFLRCDGWLLPFFRLKHRSVFVMLVRYLAMGNNNLTGSIPDAVTGLTSLT